GRAGGVGGHGKHRSVLARRRCWKRKVCKCCWWIPGSWRKCRGGTKNRTRPIVNGSNGCTVAACCEVRSGPRKQCACCARWCEIRQTWWRRVGTGCGGCKRVSTK